MELNPIVGCKPRLAVPLEYLAETVRRLIPIFKFKTVPSVHGIWEIGAHTARDTFWIIDEYWICMTELPLHWKEPSRNALRLAGVHGLGHGAQRCLFLSGFCKAKLVAFLTSCFPEINIIHMGRNADYCRVNEEIPRWNIIQRAQVRECHNEILREARKCLERGQPVIIFGFTWNRADRGTKTHAPSLPSTTELIYLDEETDALMVAQNVQDKDNVCLFLHDKFYYGFDVKFKVDARVLIYAEQAEHCDKVHQQFGRGNRTMTTDLGTLYIKGQPGAASAQQNHYEADTGPELYQGAAILRLVASLHQLKDTSVKAELAEKLYASFVTNWSTFSASWSEAAKGAVEELAETLQLEMPGAEE